MASDASDKPWDDVVLDTSAFIQGEVEPLRRIAHRLWTVPQVLEEVRDKKAKQNASFALDVIPERIEMVVPSKASIDFVVEFAKKTGDFQALSKTDLLVLALTHELRTKREGQVGESELLAGVKDAVEGEDEQEDDESASQSTNKTAEKVETTSSKPSPWSAAPRPLPPMALEPTPAKPVDVTDKPGKHVMWSEEDFTVDGAQAPAKKEPEEEWPSLTKALPAKEPAESVSVWSKNVALESIKREQQIKDAMQAREAAQMEAQGRVMAPQNVETLEESPKKEVPVWPMQSRILKPQMVGMVESARAPSEDDADLEWAGPGSQSTGWTHVSKKGVKTTATKVPVTSGSAIRVACSTADFACQNVLLQLKLGVVSLDGRRITQVKSWVSKCDACLRMFPADQKRLFCPQCGHASLSRLAYSTDASGQRRYHYSRSRRIKTQGNIFPIPRKADILLTEDQLLSGIWAQRAQRKQSNVSMFGADVNDALGVDLRRTDASQLKVGYGSINPNARKGRERRGASKSKGGGSKGKQ